MGFAGTKANSDGLSVSFGCLFFFFAKAYLKNIFEYVIYSTLFN